MDRSNWNPQNPNPDAARLKAGLKKKQTASARPSTRAGCASARGACRGPHGIAHTKFFLFSKAGKAKDVVIYGSNNATELAAEIQWNDVYTRVNKPDEYAEFESVFQEMAKDKKPKGGGYRVFTHGKFQIDLLPVRRQGRPDHRTRRSTCSTRSAARARPAAAASRATPRSGSPRPRCTASAASRSPSALAQMHRRGCDIRLVYAMFGNEVLRILRQEARPPIPMTHLAWDRDEDGIYDRYVHMKTIAISGVYDGKTDAMVTVNGSANWTPVSLASDEVLGVLQYPKATRAVHQLDRLPVQPPAHVVGRRGRRDRRHRRRGGTPPYRRGRPLRPDQAGDVAMGTRHLGKFGVTTTVTLALTASLLAVATLPVESDAQPAADRSTRAAARMSACADVLVVGVDGNGERPARGNTFGRTVQSFAGKYERQLGAGRSVKLKRVGLRTPGLAALTAGHRSRQDGGLLDPRVLVAALVEHRSARARPS